MGVARQMGEYCLWPSERALGIDEPARPLERREIGGERLGVGERRVLRDDLDENGGGDLDFEAAAGSGNQEPPAKLVV